MTERALAILDEFLASNAFRSAAMVSVTEMVRDFMYEQLKGLGTIYPFASKQIWFMRVEPGI